MSKVFVVSYKSTYFVRNHSEAKNKYTEDDIVIMIEFLVDNIFVEWGGVIFQQAIGINSAFKGRVGWTGLKFCIILEC